MPEIFFFAEPPAPQPPKPTGAAPDKKPEWGWNPNGTGPPPPNTPKGAGLPDIFFAKAQPPSLSSPPSPPPSPPKEKKPTPLPDRFFMKAGNGPAGSPPSPSPTPPAPAPACANPPACGGSTNIVISAPPPPGASMDTASWLAIHAPAGGPFSYYVFG